MNCSIPFKLHTFQGDIEVSITSNQDPSFWGFDILTKEKQNNESVKGFPVCEAHVRDFSGSGYHSFMGWIQFIRYTIDNKEFVIVDRAPKYNDVDFPFFTWGVKPTFFDAPAMLNEDRSRKSNVDWLADAFLVSSPSGLMEKEILPLASFSWGYTVTSSGEIQVKELKNTRLQSWKTYKDLFSKNFPNWYLIE